MTDYCRNYAKIAYSSPHPDTRYRFFTRLRCKRWHCDYCGNVNASMWRAHLLNQVNKFSTETMRWSFLTMTSPSYVREPHASYNRVNVAFRKLSELWRKYHKFYGGLSIEYARTLEAHADGAIHLHAIIAHDLPLAGMVNINHAKKYPKNRKNHFDKPSFRGIFTWRINDLAPHFGAGYKAELTPIAAANAGLVVAYITKYITKDVQGVLDLPPNARRIVTSRGFGKFGAMDEELGVQWTVDDNLSWQRYVQIQRDCDGIRDMQRAELITLSSYEESATYPPPSDRITI